MNLVENFCYRGWTIEIYDNNSRDWKYEYVILKGIEKFTDPTSHKSISATLKNAQADIDVLEER